MQLQRPKPAAVYAASYLTREQTGGHLPKCSFCHHTTERVFSVTEATHHVELWDKDDRAFACVQCWSAKARMTKDAA